MATSQGFNKARVNFKQVARKRSQERAKRNGKAEKGKLAVKLVSGACTKKHARKVAHARKMAAANAAAAAAAQAQQPSPAGDVAMKKKRTPKQKADAMQE
ncbi:hypothetical protein V8C86DRAFT_1553574 [Haematococcus lacustris]